MAKILMIIPPERFRDEELFVTKEVLTTTGHQVTTASIVSGIIKGSRGGSITADILITDVKITDYQAVVFVGGGGSKLYFHNADVQKIARQTYQNGQVVAAICLAPVILANAGILDGVKATVAGTESKTIVNQGAIYTGPGVMVDKKIVTANGPKSSQLFAAEINKLLQNLV
jgi:protease I